MIGPQKVQDSGPLGVLDSGVGGLSVLLHLRRQLPAEEILYFADQAHIPYGQRSQSEVQQFTAQIAHFLIRQGAKLIVVACNTASAAALDHLRETYPAIPVIGMEPAVKPAAAATQTRRVGVLATPGTLNSHRYTSLMARYGNGITVLEDPCPGLVQLIESGDLSNPDIRAILEQAVDPMIAAGVDTLVLGCTHYPFILPALREIVGPGVSIIDPAPAVARHTRNVLEQRQLASHNLHAGFTRCFTTGDSDRFTFLMETLLGERCVAQKVCWRDAVLSTDCV